MNWIETEFIDEKGLQHLIIELRRRGFWCITNDEKYPTLWILQRKMFQIFVRPQSSIYTIHIYDKQIHSGNLIISDQHDAEKIVEEMMKIINNKKKYFRWMTYIDVADIGEAFNNF